MDKQIFFLASLTAIIHVVDTLGYSVRIVGVRTGRIAASFALFNIIVLVSRTANSFHAPLLAKRVENSLLEGVATGAGDFRLLLWTAAGATLIGAFMIPSFYRLFARVVHAFDARRSLLFLFSQSFTRRGGQVLASQLHRPRVSRLKTLLTQRPAIPLRIIIANTLAVAMWTCGVLAAIYAGYLNPELRATASNLASVINGVGTILLFVVVDPHMSAMTDDAAQGRVNEASFQNGVAWLVLSRFAGALLAQVVLVPAAHIIAVASALL